tara:strand:+ start:4045 stop:4728 length:684 start_codon:yes stop_codon:yes gene_type:complete
MKHYNTYGLSITIHDHKLLGINRDLMGRLEKSKWEPREAAALKILSPHATVIELGACIGIISCLINKKLLDGTRHVAVEANPLLIDQLASIRDENDCNFHIENCMVGEKSDERTFYINPSHAMDGSAQLKKNKKACTIKQKTLQELEKKYSMPFDTLIMDIEHGEYDLFRECLLPDKRFLKFDTIICEFHDARRHPVHMKRILSELRKYYNVTAVGKANLLVTASRL